MPDYRLPKGSTVRYRGRGQTDPRYRYSLAGREEVYNPQMEALRAAPPGRGPADFHVPPLEPAGGELPAYQGSMARIGETVLPEPARVPFGERPGTKRFMKGFTGFISTYAQQYAPARPGIQQILAEQDREVEYARQEEKESRLAEERRKEKEILQRRRVAYGANDPGLLHPDDPERVQIQEYTALNPENMQNILGAQLGKSIRQEPKVGPGPVAPEGWEAPPGAVWFPGKGYQKDPTYQAPSTREPSFGPVEDLEDSILEVEKNDVRSRLAENIGLDSDEEIPDPYDELGADMIKRGDLVRNDQMRLREIENEVQLRKRQLDRYKGRLGDAGAYRGKELPTQAEMGNVENAPELLPGEEFDDYVDRLVATGWFPKLAVAAAHSKGLVDPEYTPSR